MYLGIDVGGTNLKFGILDDNNDLVFRSVEKTNAHLGIDNLIENLLRNTGVILNNFHGIRSIGIGVPGIVDNNGTVLFSPNLPGCKNIAVRKKLEEKFMLPVVADNDANVGAIAEARLGKGSGISHFLYVTLGTGVGGAIIQDGGLFRGYKGAAGEIGHIIIRENEDEASNLESFRIGTLEEFIGKNGILKMARFIINATPGTSLENDESLDIKTISDAADRNDLAGTKIMAKTGYFLGIGLSSALNLLGYSTVIIGGGISQSSNIMYESALKTIKSRALPNISREALIYRAAFLADAGITGACLLGKDSLK